MQDRDILLSDLNENGIQWRTMDDSRRCNALSEAMLITLGAGPLAMLR